MKIYKQTQTTVPTTTICREEARAQRLVRIRTTGRVVEITTERGLPQMFRVKDISGIREWYGIGVGIDLGEIK